MKKKAVIIGGGAAGMMAAAFLDNEVYEVCLLERNEKLGKKLFITGKGRCNLTNAGTHEEVTESIMRGKKFMYSAFNAFDNFDVIDFFENNGLRTVTERGNRVFPQSGHSSDVIKTLENVLRKRGVKICLNSYVAAMEKSTEDGKIIIKLKDGSSIEADACIVATGGLSYPKTGSTGDGYKFAKAAGHQIEACMPSLVSLHVKEKYPAELEGLSLKNVTVTLKRGDKHLYSDMGEMLFTHDGVSGPLILSASSVVGAAECDKGDVRLIIDLKPALSVEQLDARILRDFDESLNKQFKNSLNNLLPRKLIEVIISVSGINPDKRVNLITKQERRALAEKLKGFEMTVCKTGSFDEAVITRGGINVSQINPKTMESKLCSGLYFIGEVLDIDALTGGFNLQLAWSTAYAAAAGLNKAGRLKENEAF